MGGAICIASENGNSSPKVINCVFEGNSAEKVKIDTYGIGGAAIIVLGYSNSYSAQAEITNCTFKGNTSTQFGGGVSVCKYQGSASATLTCCTFTGNTATTGGGIFTSDTVTLNNCTFINNSGYEIYVNNDTANQGKADAKVTAKNSIIWNSDSTKIKSGTVDTSSKCITTLTSAPTSSPSTKGAYGINHTVFLIENNAATLTDCVYAGEAIANLTTDQLGRTFNNPLSIGAVELSENLAITTDSLTAGTINQDYNATITATGTEPLAWTISGLPSGLSANTTTTGKTLTITGTPTASGNSSVKVNVSSFGGKVKAEEKTLA